MIEIEMVEIPSVTFKIGKYPITQEQYEAVMGTNPSYFKNKPQNPVESVSYSDAIVFCQKLSQMTGKTYRLPTDSEWEYACRAGAETLFSFGDNFEQLKDYAWYEDNSGFITHPVGLKLPMLGDFMICTVTSGNGVKTFPVGADSTPAPMDVVWNNSVTSILKNLAGVIMVFG